MTSRSEFIQKVSEIQKKLKAPKSQYNSFGKYNYRNQEDILEAVKPLLGDLVLTINDELVLIGDRYYIKATATITDTFPWFFAATKDMIFGSRTYHGGDFFIGEIDSAYLWYNW